MTNELAETPPCPHRPPCLACPRYGAAGLSAAATAALAALAQQHGLPPVTVHAGARAGFRLRARLAIRGRAGAPSIGLFAPGTHRVLAVPGCVIHHGLVNQVTAAVRGALADAGVSCYSERTRLGHARYLQVVIERSSQRAQVVIVANSESAAPLAGCFALLQERLGPALHSLWYNANASTGNAVLGAAFERIAGPESVVEHFGGPAIHYPPGAFGQSNLELASLIIAQLREQVPAGARVAEFYAGVGAIGLSLLARAGALMLNEVNPHSLRGLEMGLAGLAADQRARIAIVPGAAGVATHMLGQAEVVIVDPPRKGLDARLLAGLVKQPPERLLYLSCGLDSLLADAAGLTADGRLRLTALSAYDLMPYTGHVETLARFERN
jgi:tRNA/tmRNA/rRNA uracil-C5-methylase (TrmA/RlmC/RlmD family)